MDDIFLFGPAFEDVVDPGHAVLCALASYQGGNVGFVEERGLGDNADGLRRVFLYVFLYAGMYEVYLEVRREEGRGSVAACIVGGRGLANSRGCPNRRHVPVIDIVGPKIRDVREGFGQDRGSRGRGWEGGALKGKE